MVLFPGQQSNSDNNPNIYEDKAQPIVLAITKRSTPNT